MTKKYLKINVECFGVFNRNLWNSWKNPNQQGSFQLNGGEVGRKWTRKSGLLRENGGKFTKPTPTGAGVGGRFVGASGGAVSTCYSGTSMVLHSLTSTAIFWSKKYFTESCYTYPISLTLLCFGLEESSPKNTVSLKRAMMWDDL